MGEAPWWYTLLKASQFLGVPPWDLLSKPTPWVDLAILSMNAEEHAREMKHKADRIRR